MSEWNEKFEKWVADEMGQTIEYIKSKRKKNILGALGYSHEEINTRYRAYRADMRSF
ncbi:hypothetical protein [Pectobacterium parmentieri]|uniref:hypothetical protein n=1 Tax=Pectobacterium parmentieri TaxID=1905730 RepID=UPI0015E7EAD1|nr:hypothetical protein [Pectobacterium parmentieri]